MSAKRILCILFSCIFLSAVLTASVSAAVSNDDTVSVFAHTDTMQVNIEDTEEIPSEKTPVWDPDKPYVALTFDDGPNILTTPKVLDVLEKYQAHATFFVLGNRINNQTAPLIARMLASGSEVGNHSYDHPILSNLTAMEIRSQLARTSLRIRSACGQFPTLVRPPYGSANDLVMTAISHPAVLWSVDTRDWETKDTDMIVEHVLNNVESGDIVLMHDIYSTTADAVEPILKALSERGYQFLTVSELLSLRGDVAEAGKKYY